LSSEAGVLPVPPETVTKKCKLIPFPNSIAVLIIDSFLARLEPGKMFLVDLKEKRVVQDGELKKKLACAYDYGAWLSEQQITWEHLGVSQEVKNNIFQLYFFSFFAIEKRYQSG
jgi:hypothetical protein